MRNVELIAGIQSSVLGFGCASILGSEGRERSARALDIAYDYGVTHFDLARSYGYGEAEKFVGKHFKAKRKKIVLTSKFGIIPDWKASLLRPVKPIVRNFSGGRKKVNNNLPKETKKKKGFSDLFLKRVEVTPAFMRKSLEKSLQALQTDFLDYYLIHEPMSGILDFDDLAATADNLKQEGKIRAWGLSFMNSQRNFHRNYINLFDVLQFDNPPDESDYRELVKNRAEKSNILFSPMNGTPSSGSPKQKLTKLFKDFPKSVVLCSMFSTEHLKENVQLAS